MAVSARARRLLENAKGYLAQARGSKSKHAAITYYAESYRQSGNAWEAGPSGGAKAPTNDNLFLAAAQQISEEALAGLRKLAKVKKENPTSKEALGAIGAGAGGLLLGPLGAAAGGYLGVKKGRKIERKAKKAARKVKKALSNPNKNKILRNAMKGT